MEKSTARKIKAMVGASEFKKLMADLDLSYVNLAETAAVEAFYRRALLFSINPGDGLTYQLELLAELAGEIEKEKVTVTHIKINQPDIIDAEDARKISPRDIVLHMLEESGALYPYGYRILCIDMSEWIDNCDGAEFRAILSRLRDTMMKQRIVFWIPAVDEQTLLRIRECIGVYMAVQEVYTPPFTIEQYCSYAEQLMDDRNMDMTPGAFELFREMIEKERKSSSFWGFESIRKMLDEAVLFMLRENYGAIDYED